MRRIVLAGLALTFLVGADHPAAAADLRIPTRLSAERTTYYIVPDASLGIGWSQICVRWPPGFYRDPVCSPPYPTPYVNGPSLGSDSGVVRLTDVNGNGVPEADVRLVGHLTGTTCRVTTDVKGYAWPWCSDALGWSLDEQGYDAFFDGNAVYAPAQPVNVEGATVKVG